MAVRVDQPMAASRALRVARSHASQAAAVLVVLTVWVFGSTLSGRTVPVGDFVASYNSEDFAWWGLGGILNPPDWMPYFWGGYPASSNLQNSAWYLPVGIAASLTKYDLHAAAVVQVLHVVFGALGMYVLARRKGRTQPAALVGMVAWFFCTGFFWSAMYVDFVRGFAWIPWLLIIFSNEFPWERWWSIPVCAVALSQTVIGIYPGMLVACIYTVPIWAAFHLWRRPPGERVGVVAKIAIAGVGAALLCLPKFVPYLLTRGESFTQDDALTFDRSVVGTAFFAPEHWMLPYPGAGFYSVFLPGVVFVLCCWAPLRDSAVRLALLIALLAISLSVATLPWHGVVTHLPGMDLSRFSFSDFRVPLLAMVTLTATYGYDHLVAPSRGRTPAEIMARVGASLTVLAGATTIAVRLEYVPSSEQWQLLLLTLSVYAVSAFALSRKSLAGVRAIGVALIVVTVASGAVGAWAERAYWAGDREALEIAALGTPISSFIDSPVVEDAARRPPRDAPHDFPAVGAQAVEGGQDKKYSRSLYTGDLALFGWVNIRSVWPYNLVKFSMATPDHEMNERTLDFWRSAGIMIEYEPQFPPSEAIDLCVDAGHCGHDVVVTPVSYSDNGTKLTYQVDTPHGATLAANEAYYPGWSARLCSPDTTCVSVEPYSSPQAVLLLDVPPGEWTLHLSYTLPGLRASWLAAGVAFVGLWVHAAWRFYTARRVTETETDHEVGSNDPALR